MAVNHVLWQSGQISRSVVSNSLQRYESQHARPPCPSPTPGVHSDSRPSGQWCHPAISSSVCPFSSCPQSLPASESFPMSQLFAWGGQSTGVSALASFLAAAKSLQLCPTLWDPIDGSHQASPSLGFSRQEHWSGLPFPSPMHECEKSKWSRSVMSDSSRPHGLQPTRLLPPWDFPGKSTGVGCHCLLWMVSLELFNSIALLFIQVLKICDSIFSMVLAIS